MGQCGVGDRDWVMGWTFRDGSRRGAHWPDHLLAVHHSLSAGLLFCPVFSRGGVLTGRGVLLLKTNPFSLGGALHELFVDSFS